jgi:phosphonate transport system substrate-binding protein
MIHLTYHVLKKATNIDTNPIRDRKHSWRRIALLFLIAAATEFPIAQAVDAPLILGVIPRRNATETAKLFTPMATYLSERLGLEVKLVTAKNFEAFWKDVAEQRYDIVHYNQYQYIRSAKTYKVIAHAQELGKNAVSGILLTRKDSGITAVSQLRGRTVIFGGGKDAMLAYIAPRYLLLQAGLKDGDYKTAFAVTPQNALVALYHKQADAAGGAEVTLDQPVIKNAINTQDLRILASTEPLLFLPWAVKQTMPPKLTLSIQSLLLDLKNSDAGRQVLKDAHLTSVEKAVDKDYDPHRKMTAAVFGAEGGAK